MTTSLFNGGRLFGAQAQPKTPKVTGMQDSFAQGFYGVRPKPAPALAAPAAPVAGRPVMRAPVVAPTTAPANLAMAQPAPQAPATDFEAGFAQVASPATVVQPTAAPATVVPAVAPAASAPTTQPSDGGWAAAKVSGLVPTEGGGWITPEEASDIAAQKSGLVRTKDGAWLRPEAAAMVAARDPRYDSPEYQNYNNGFSLVADSDLTNAAQDAFFKLQTGGGNAARLAYMDKLKQDPAFVQKSKEASRIKYEELARQGKYGSAIQQEQRLRDAPANRKIQRAALERDVKLARTREERVAAERILRTSIEAGLA